MNGDAYKKALVGAYLELVDLRDSAKDKMSAYTGGPTGEILATYLALNRATYVLRMAVERAECAPPDARYE